MCVCVCVCVVRTRYILINSELTKPFLLLFLSNHTFLKEVPLFYLKEIYKTSGRNYFSFREKLFFPPLPVCYIFSPSKNLLGRSTHLAQVCDLCLRSELKVKCADSITRRGRVITAKNNYNPN